MARLIELGDEKMDLAVQFQWMAKRALITGNTGQDGSYLAELLLENGYEVFGVIRRLSAPNTWRIDHLRGRITLCAGDLLDQLSIIRLLDQHKPDEFYNLAAMSFVPTCNATGDLRATTCGRCG
jgi:GDPmannose 4,6-dehydratase